jgi:hypothetical protein
LSNTTLTDNLVRLVSGYPAVLPADCAGKLLAHGANRIGRSAGCVIEEGITGATRLPGVVTSTR